MATDLSPALDLASTPTPPAPTTSRAWRVAAALSVLAVVIVVGINSRSGAVAGRIANPAVQGAPRPVEPLFGFHHWIALHQIGTILMMITLTTVVVVGWKRKPGNPVLLMVIVMTLLIWQDPIMNWAPYAVYNPALRHWPETWPLVSLSPTVEPFIVVGYATFYMAPFFPGSWLLRRIQARRPAESFVWRHPLITLSLLMFGIGLVFDACLEIFLVRTQLYIYSQVIPFGSFAVGKWYQFPLIWETALVTTVMIPAGILLYRDDTGRTKAERLAQRARLFRGRPALGTFAVMFAVINVAYFFAYGGGYTVIKWTKTATSVACPWPFPEAKVYDPNGFYAKQGTPGPYSPGIWAGWESGQGGRPDMAAATSGRCR
ncbi:MAG TPA: spirocyclase AveC family protein [Acidimicrobiales bacterium]|nr:spirocyclase AveC family protein [Acidimicrobiales bacterium]